MAELLTLWKRAVSDQTDLIERIFALLDDNGVSYCLIGGVAVNAYVDPVFTADLDIALATDDIERVRELMGRTLIVREFPHSLNVSERGTKLQIQFQLDPLYSAFVARAERRAVLDLFVPVAALEDLFQGKVWAASDDTRRVSKHLKDLSDIARLIEAYPHLIDLVPAALIHQVTRADAQA